VSRRAALGVAVATLVFASLAGPARAAEPEREIVSDALAQAFTLRTSVDQGGSVALPFYFGSYADAFLTTPPAGADGQASWYNLGIAETAVFKPAGECTPQEQAARAQQAVRDVATWITDTALPTLLRGNMPVAPIPTLPCSERIPGFAQSRYPATETIGPAASDDLLGTYGPVQGGSFVAEATDRPSQSSDALMLGIALPPLLRIGAARAVATTALEGNRVVASAEWTLSDLCLAPGPTGCALEIAKMRQIARIVRAPDGTVVEREARTVVAGVRGAGPAADVTAEDLGPGLPPIDLGGYLQVQAVADTFGCGDPALGEVADAGGLRITGKRGSEGPDTPPLPIPLFGTAEGGGLMIGGACASGRIQEVAIPAPGLPEIPGGGPGAPTILPPLPGLGGAPGSQTPTLLSPPRVVERETVRYVLRSAPAWRTAPYWASILGAMALLTAVGYAFRRTPVVAPVTTVIDRFGRQFIRG
jgi:hypothetical protein